MIYYYILSFVLSVVLSVVYCFVWQKHFDINISLIFAFIPIGNLAHLLLASSSTLSEALTANKVIYISGCYTILFIIFSIAGLCHIKISRYIRALMIIISSALYASALTIGKSDIFYKTVTFVKDDVGYLAGKNYGFMHTVFYVMIISYFLFGSAILIYTYFKKKDISRKTLQLLFLPVAIAVLGYFGQKIFGQKIEFMPACYVFAQIIYLFVIRRLSLYDINDSSIDSLVEKGDTGFASFDFKYRYLGSNETARKFMPVLDELVVDDPIRSDDRLKDTILKWIDEFNSGNEHNTFLYKSADGEHFYEIVLTYLYVGMNKRGYQLFITDDTADQQFIRLLDSYNSDLENEVNEKTSHIVKMHDNLILSMATMVESRDNSTGGHIRRTSEGVRILIDEIKKDPSLNLDESFCNNVIKAAPMHDLGKIAVDDAILRKPGRFEAWEFEKMKAHAAEGARIVDQILKETDDETFRKIAVNVAHYHHERWDGSGYPDGLKGDQIPLEARIMAIADVYDALVSKRVYKDSMSFEKADSIIMEGMGSQFDKGLERYYISARPQLEAYYSSLSTAEN